MKNSVGSRSAASGFVGAAVVAHVAYSVRSRTYAVICNWKGLEFFFNLCTKIGILWKINIARGYREHNKMLDPLGQAWQSGGTLAA